MIAQHEAPIGLDEARMQPALALVGRLHPVAARIVASEFLGRRLWPQIDEFAVAAALQLEARVRGAEEPVRRFPQAQGALGRTAGTDHGHLLHGTSSARRADRDS